MCSVLTVAVRVQRGQLERFGERDAAGLTGGRLGDDQIAALKCAVED